MAFPAVQALVLPRLAAADLTRARRTPPATVGNARVSRAASGSRSSGSPGASWWRRR